MVEAISPISVCFSINESKQFSRLDSLGFHPKKLEAIDKISKFKIEFLEDVTSKIDTGATPAKKDYKKSGVGIIKVGCLSNQNVIKWEKIEYVSSSKYNSTIAIQEEDIVIICASHAAGYIGKNSSIVRDIPIEHNGKLLNVGETMYIRANKEKIDPYYLLALMNVPEIQTQMQYSVRGQTIHLYPTDVRKIKIPRLKKEQEKEIAKEMKECINCYLSAIKEKNLAKSIFESILKVSDVKKSEEVTVKYKKSSCDSEQRIDPKFFNPKYCVFIDYINKFPILSLGSIDNTITSGSTPKENLNPFTDSINGVPFIRNKDLKDGIIVRKNLKYLKSSAHNRMATSKVKKNNVLIAMTGSLGESAILLDFDEANVNQNISRLRNNSAKLRSEFIVLFMNSIFGKIQMEKIYTGPVQKYVNNNLLKKILVPVLDFKEQTNMANHIDKFNDYFNEYNISKKKVYGRIDNYLKEA